MAKKVSKVEWLSKENQKKFENSYIECMTQVWNGNKKMIDYCRKKVAVYVPICGDKIMTIDKTDLNKEFYFGYSSCGQGPSYEDMNKTVSNVSKNIEKHFIEENLARVNDQIKDYKEVLKGDSRFKLFARKAYHHQVDDVIIGVEWVNYFNYFGFSEEEIKERYGVELSKDDVKNIIKGLEEFKEMKTKQINTYLKRFGTTKLGIRTYWIDD